MHVLLVVTLPLHTPFPPFTVFCYPRPRLRATTGTASTTATIPYSRRLPKAESSRSRSSRLHTTGCVLSHPALHFVLVHLTPPPPPSPPPPVCYARPQPAAHLLQQKKQSRDPSATRFFYPVTAGIFVCLYSFHQQQRTSAVVTRPFFHLLVSRLSTGCENKLL